MSVWEQGGRPFPALAFEDWAMLLPAAPLPSAILERGNPHTRPSV